MKEKLLGAMWWSVLFVSFVLALPGCFFDSGPASTANTSDKCVIKTGRYINDKLSTTTPEQDKAFIKALYADINALDAAIRGTTANQATQALVAGPQKPAPVVAPAPAPSTSAATIKVKQP